MLRLGVAYGIRQTFLNAPIDRQVDRVAITAWQVAGLGGCYRIDSAPGRGTNVRITIPLGEGGANT